MCPRCLAGYLFLYALFWQLRSAGALKLTVFLFLYIRDDRDTDRLDRQCLNLCIWGQDTLSGGPLTLEFAPHSDLTGLKSKEPSSAARRRKWSPPPIHTTKNMLPVRKRDLGELKAWLCTVSYSVNLKHSSYSILSPWMDRFSILQAQCSIFSKYSDLPYAKVVVVCTENVHMGSLSEVGRVR